jgi:translation initiation factor 2A
MPIVAHSNEGLTPDAFDESCGKFPCQKYALEADKLSWFHNNRLRYYDLTARRMILETDVDDPKEIKIANDGSVVGVLTHKGMLLVLNAEGVNFRAHNVSEFRLSSGLLAFTSQGSFLIHEIRDTEVCEKGFHSSRIAVLSFCVFGSLVFLATRKLAKDGKHKLLRISRQQIEVLGSYDAVQGFSAKAHPSEKFFLLFLTTSYLKGSYFAESDVYFYDAEKNSSTKINCGRVHHFTFLSGGFAVCHGNQPSDVSVFDLDCRQIFRLPRGTRNVAAFNHQESMAVCCGFGNLSGDIEVFDVKARRSVAKFAVLGASLADWECSGAYFYVSTTNYFQEDNRITMYDYYGRAVGERRFSSLFSAQAYGEKRDFVNLNAPKQAAAKKETRYVPPSLRGARTPAMAGRPVQPRERTKEEILADLETIQRLKERMENGEELDIKELNLILRESKLISELNGPAAE